MDGKRAAPDRSSVRYHGRASVVRVGGRELRVSLAAVADDGMWVEVEDENGERHRKWIATVGPGRVLLDHEPFEFELWRDREGRLAIRHYGESWPVEVLSEAEASALSRISQRDGSGERPLQVRAPMPGRLLAVHVEEEAPVEPEQALFVIEAMKMENEVRAPSGGVIRGLSVAAGDAVEQNQELCEIHPGAR
jgi:biotin carboxyl carrier protein